VKVAVVGTEETATRIANELRQHGVNAYAVAALEVKPLEDALEYAREVVGRARTLVFTSKRAARMVVGRVCVPKGVVVVAIGPKTAEALSAWGPRVPRRHCSSGVLEELRSCPDPIALFSSTRVSPALEEYVVGRGGFVVKLYDLIPHEVFVDADVVIPLSATPLEKIKTFGKILALSSRIAECARRLGLFVVATVEVERMDELVRRIVEILQAHKL